MLIIIHFNTCYIWYKRKHTTPPTFSKTGIITEEEIELIYFTVQIGVLICGLVNLDPLSAVVRADVVPAVGACSISYSGSDATQRIKIARPSVSWLSSAESHERINAVRSLLRLWLPGKTDTTLHECSPKLIKLIK